MGLYIPGMKMPEKEGVGLFLYPDGRVNVWRPHALVGQKYETVSVPPHGRLIDADAFIKENEYFADRDFNNPRYDTTLRELVGTAPTIIPAEEAAT